MKIVIMQGLPGSGKTSYRTSRSLGEGAHLAVSADFHFIDAEGVYRFDASKLGEAHARCMRNFIDQLCYAQDLGEHGVVIVDNTNITQADMAPYYLVGRAFGAEVEVVRINCDPRTAHMRNTHGVPFVTVERMYQNMEDPAPYWECKFTIVEADPAVAVVSVSRSRTVDGAGSVDADVTVDGAPYAVTLCPASYDGALGAWGDLDHWISGPAIHDLSRATLDTIVAEVVYAAERAGLVLSHREIQRLDAARDAEDAR